MYVTTTTTTAPTAFKNINDIDFSRHFIAQVRNKNFTADQILAALTNPYKITEVRRYPGQWRFCGGGIAVVVAMDRTTPVAVTAYLDGVVTPLRKDQMSDPEALNSKRLGRAG